MTTQTSSSPFATEPSSGPMPASSQDKQAEFQIHTMQDDLLSLQNKGVVKEPVPEKTPEYHAPISPQVQQLKPVMEKEAPKEIFKEPFSVNTAEPLKKPEENKSTLEFNEVKQQSNIPTEHKGSSVKIIFAIIIILVIGIIGLGAYYFLITKQSDDELAVNQVETPIVTEPQVEPPVVVETPVAASIEKYSSDKPNYLPLNMNEVGEEEIKNSIINASAEVKTLNKKAPYEFIVVDEKNNPISFPIFATAAKLNLSQALLSSLESDFSLFLYSDNSKMRLAISVAIGKKDVLTKELTKQEKTFVTDGAFLFLENTPEIKSGAFQTSKHGSQDIRFFNVNSAKDLSIDYALTESQFIIGTSKNTIRAVLDNLQPKLGSVAPATSIENNSPTINQ